MNSTPQQPSLSLRFRQALAVAWAVVTRVWRQPLEPILHPSVWRLRWVGMFLFVGQTLYGLIWQYVIPQTYENLSVRMFLSCLGFLLVLRWVTQNINSRIVRYLFVTIFWIELPLFFNIMFVLNNGSPVWLASCVGMVLIYYHLTDWRLATVGMAASFLVAYVVVAAIDSSVVFMTGINATTYFFAWAAALVLGLSSVNMRAEQLNQTLSTMGILAHELRTPIASVALMGDVLAGSAKEMRSLGAAVAADRLERMTTRLESLVRMMHVHIDTQIANARQSLPQAPLESLQASTCIRHMLADYPFGTEAQRAAPLVEIEQDFSFLGVRAWMTQVLNNLMKNALYALASKQMTVLPGDIRLLLSCDAMHDLGFIRIIDYGIGIPKLAQKNVFEPFYSSQRGASHGLGLAYCKRTIHALGGAIHLSSEPGISTTITLQLPVQLTL